MSHSFRPGDLVRARGREWVVLPLPGDQDSESLLRLRPLSGSEEDATLIYLPLETEKPQQAVFAPPDLERHKPGSQDSALLLRDALRLKLRAGAGPFRSFGGLNFEPRAYQLVPLLMGLKMETIRLLIADDVGIGKTIEAGLIVKELMARGELEKFTVVCPPHLCEQWQSELEEKFSIRAEVVRTGTVSRLERNLPAGESVFDVHPVTVVSLDYIKQDRRRSEFERACPDFVIVDEAHACVRSGAGTTRHRRFELVKKLAEKSARSMVFLTATPHSGDERAFENLLGLLDAKFAPLADLGEGDERSRLREELARCFVQRRRGDIAEWQDASAGFPQRESREDTYRLSGDWGKFFDDVLGYARTIVERESGEGGTTLRQRMSWWTALALLRCASSSPAAALQALRTKLQAPEGATDADQVKAANQKGREDVLDESDDDSLSLSETAPAGDAAEVREDIQALQELIARAEALQGAGKDPKLKKLIAEAVQLIADGFKPVIFCRYISTAHYVGEALAKAKKLRGKIRIEVVTGELTPDQRKERVDALGSGREGDESAPVLVATDCLSEGINLQQFFDAAIHYDLTWNPTRHEQREGRVDRFGQSSPAVRTLMLYGENNAVDWAVMQVILRKAEKIREELGVLVPLPSSDAQVIEEIMEAILFQGGGVALRQGELPGLEQIEEQGDRLEQLWMEAGKRQRESTRTVFAQRRLTPEDVMPEWKKAASALGGADDVRRFVCTCTERLGAALDERKAHQHLPLEHFPAALRERLESAGLSQTKKISFEHPAPGGAAYIHRAHPLVAGLADYVVDRVLDEQSAGGDDDRIVGSRTGAFFVRRLEVRTVLYLLRLRSQIAISRRGAGQKDATRYILAEECLGVAVRDDASAPETLSHEEALKLLQLETGQNMQEGQRVHLLKGALSQIEQNREIFDRIARARADELLADHRRVREAGEARGRYDVRPSLPVDVIGIYVLVPSRV